MPSNQGKQSSSSLEKLRWPVILLLSVLVILGATGGSFYLYVLDQERYFNDRYFRLLSSLGNNVTVRFDDFKKIFSITADFTDKALNKDSKDLNARVKNINLELYQNCLQSAKPDKYEAFYASVLCQVPEFSHFNAKIERPYKDDRVAACPGPRDLGLRDFSFSVSPPAASAARLWPIISKMQWYSPTKKKGECRLLYWNVSVQADIKQVIDQILVDSPFDDLLLSDQTGQVVFQYSETSLRFNRIGLLFPSKQESLKKNEKSDESESSSRTASRQQANEPKFLERVPARQEVNIGGKDMYVFMTTMNLRTEDAATYILIGLVSKEKFRTQTWQLSPSVVLGLLFAAFLVLLSLPLLKLLTMGPQDRWSMTDFCLLVSAGILGLGLLTIGIIDISIFRMTKDSVDDKLLSVSESVSTKFGKELNALISHLAKSDKPVSLGNVKEELEGKDLSCLRGANVVFPTTKSHVLKEVQGKPTDYQFFDSIFWVDCSGRLRVHWDSRYLSNYTPPIAPNLIGRPYVSNVLKKRLYHLKETNKSEKRPPLKETNEAEKLPPFWIDPVYSWVDGQFTTIISIQSAHAFPGEPTNAVAAIETHLSSLEGPIIENGTGFAIVDSSSGKVLFHSDKKRNLRENFFDETDGNRTLKALSLSRGTDCFDGKYSGTSHRFCTKPLEDLPWTLIVFQSMEPLRAANLQAVIISSALYGVYALVVSLLLSIALTLRALRFAGLPDWIWPTESRYRQYRMVTWINCALLVIGSLALFLFSSQYAFTVAVMLLPLLAAICVLGVVYDVLPGQAREKVAGAGDGPWGYRKSYLTASGTMLALCSVLPATVCLSLSYEAESVLLMKSGALQLARGLAERADRINQHYRSQNEFASLIKERLVFVPQSEPVSPKAVQPQEIAFAQDIHLAKYSAGMLPGYDGIELVSGMVPVTEEAKPVTSKPQSPENQQESSVNARGDLSEQWFDNIQKTLRMSYNDEFVKTHGLTAVAKKTEDAQWECKSEKCSLIYRPVSAYYDAAGAGHAKSIDERWKVTLVRSSVERFIGGIFVVLPIVGVFLISLSARVNNKAVVFKKVYLIGVMVGVLLVGIAGCFIPDLVLITISLVAMALAFIWLIYALPTIVARRIFLLDFPSVPITAHEALSFAMNEERLPLEAQELVGKEFSASPYLVEIGNRAKEKVDRLQSLVSHVGPQQGVASFVYEQALEDYRKLWAQCTKYEKAALFQLAKTGFLSIVHAAIPLLLEKRVVLRDPAPRLMNQSFRQFVLSQEEEIAKLREEVSEGTWNLLEWPIGVTLALILAGLMYTQEELPSALSALVAGVPVLLPTIFKLLDLFKNEKPSISSS